MKRLTDELAYPLTTFKRCQICGFESNDIVDFKMWAECNDQDEPEPGNVLVVCDARLRHACRQVVEEHPRLYRELEWGEGLPGYFMLLCGDCSYRKGRSCTHPKLRSNGGAGLEVRVGGPFTALRVCFHDGTSMTGPKTAVRCAGHQCTDAACLRSIRPDDHSKST